MSRRSLHLVAGLGLFLVGGAALAFGEGPMWTATGTTLGLAGVGIAAWGWIIGQRE